MVAATQLIQTASRFQRAIHVRYDLHDAETIEQYIPTFSTANALSAIINGTHPEGTQRAHVLHASYGSGKSHFAVALSALLENNDYLRPAIRHFVERIAATDSRTGELAYEYLDHGTRLLPVVLSGNEGDLTTALFRALSRALDEADLGSVQLVTRFEAARHTIDRWEQAYPDVLNRLAEEMIRHFDLQLEGLQAQLEAHDPQAFEYFEHLYPQLTGGATFDPFTGQTPDVAFRDVAGQIRSQGYDGLVVLWDEFGRYLEARVSQAFSSEAALLQSFAEACNYSGEEQLHLLLFTHKELQGYAAALPKTYQQEWSRIEGRFQRHTISTDPYIAYRLIDAAIQPTDSNLVDELIGPELEHLVRWSREKHLFGVLESEAVATLIQGTWPLHPLTVFALTHLSNRVAQNERTMFTFLTSDEPRSLAGVFRIKSLDEPDELFVRSDVLWDYFEDAVRSDIGGTGTHRYWAGVSHALDKVTDTDALGRSLIKTLGVLLVCAEFTPVKPDTDLLCWAVGANNDEQRAAVAATLENLRRRKVIINRQIDGYWTFISGSDINFEERLTAVLERINPSPAQLRRVLQDYVPAPYTLARRYNQERDMIRYFTGMYRWPHELEDAPWNTQLDRSDTDGLVIYVLVEDELGWEQALQAVQSHERVVYVLPRQQHVLVSLQGILRELVGLQEISNDSSLKQHEDRARIQREIDWLLEDARTRLQRIVATLIDPREDKSVWITVENGTVKGYPVQSLGQTTKIVSDVCGRVFARTPVFNSEGLNVYKPSTQQLGAAQKVIEALFTHPPDETFGMEGSGPEILALNTLLRLPGILHQNGTGEWRVARPDDNPPVAEVWDCIATYIDDCLAENGAPIEPLFRQLTSPPYGIRPGVIPVLLAAELRTYLKVMTVRRDGRAVTSVDGSLLTQMISDADHYSIEIGEWNETLEHLWMALETRFDAYIHENERNQQPLTRLRLALLRWLQSLPPFCRDTRQISTEAQAFRDLVRKAQMEPAHALFEELPDLLALDETVSPEEIQDRLDSLVTETSNAYLDLQRRLDVFAIEEFGQGVQHPDGLNAMRIWVDQIQGTNGKSITEFRFGSLITQDLIDALISSRNGDGQFWNKASLAVLGIQLRDWNDSSEERFYQRLLSAREEVEREVHELVEEDAVVAVSLQLPNAISQDYRFRYSDLSTQGKHLLQNFKSTMEIAGRPLSMDEKRQIAIAFLTYMMGEDLDD
jgi:hypothetical protein